MRLRDDGWNSFYAGGLTSMILALNCKILFLDLLLS